MRARIARRWPAGSIGACPFGRRSMKGRVLGAVAVLAGLACALAVFAYTGSVRAEVDTARTEALARYGGETVEVCVARRNLSPGEAVDASNTEQRPWLVDLLPKGAVESPDAVAGRELTSSVVQGEVLSLQRFEGRAAGLSVPPGTQAVTIEVPSAQAVGGALAAGSKVDVYSALASGVAEVARGCQVLACGSSGGARSWVTLSVEPPHVQELIAAAQAGGVYLALPATE